MRKTLAGAGALAAAGGAARLLFRLRPLRAVPAPRPAFDYAGAVARVAGLQAVEGDALNAACRTRLLTHGDTADKAIALLHGFTNCPQQFSQLAERFFALGYNVLVPRLPRHGLADRAAPGFERLTAEELVVLTAETVDILHGLGRRTMLFGFSLGGLMAAWAAQNRASLDHVALVSPALALQGFRLPAQRAYGNLLLTLPDKFIWWDPVRKEEAGGPAHAYPGVSSRALGQLMRLAAIVRAQAGRQPYAARAVTVVTNPCDDTVDNRGVAGVVANWRRLGVPVHTHEFPATWGLIHDIIDPAQEKQQVAAVYPRLVEWADREIEV
jgi:carboxylesterase